MLSKLKEQNARKYLSKKWTSGLFANYYIKTTMKETFNIYKKEVLENGLTVYFHGQRLHFNCLKEDNLNIDFEFKDLGKNGPNAEICYEDNLITFNECRKKDASHIYSNLSHEFSHKIQWELVKHMDKYDKESIEYEYLKRLCNQLNRNLGKVKPFNIEVKGRMYINPQALEGTKFEELAIAMYMFQLTERNAFSIELQSLKYLEKISGEELVLDEDRKLDWATCVINEHYKTDFNFS